MKQEFNFNLQDSLNKANETYGSEYKSKLGKTYSMTQLQQDREFNERAERFLEAIGEDDNIIEYLRDSDYSLTSAMMRASEIGNWSDQTKRDYVYLRDKYSQADLTGIREWAGFAKYCHCFTCYTLYGNFFGCKNCCRRVSKTRT